MVYFYTKGGNFQPTFFLATCVFVEALASKKRLDKFTGVRSKFEDYIIENKEHLSLITHKFGSGARSLPWLVRYFEMVLAAIVEGTSAEDLLGTFGSDPNFAVLALPKDRSRRFTRGRKAIQFWHEDGGFFCKCPQGRHTLCNL